MTVGVLNVLKPPKMTSHDVIGFLRRVLNTKKIGHSGTLDPDASGVLPVFVGQATKLLEYAIEERKCYRAEITFGMRTDSGDDSGVVLEQRACPQITEQLLQNTLQGFVGAGKQIPPMYSAVKVNGRPLYKLARQGIEIERAPRDIYIYALRLLDFTPQACVLEIECSKGTYIRTLLEDICKRMDAIGTMSFLLRLSVGAFKIEQAVTLQEIEQEPMRYLIPAESVVTQLPELQLSEKQAWRITQGVKTTIAGTTDGLYRLKGTDGAFYGIGKAEAEIVKPEKLLQQAPKPLE